MLISLPYNVRDAAAEKLRQLEARGFRMLLVVPFGPKCEEWKALYAPSARNTILGLRAPREVWAEAAPGTNLRIHPMLPRHLVAVGNSTNYFTFDPDAPAIIAAQCAAAVWSTQPLAYDAEWLRRLAQGADTQMRRHDSQARVLNTLEGEVVSAATATSKLARSNVLLDENFDLVRRQSAYSLALHGITRAVAAGEGIAAALQNPYLHCDRTVFAHFRDLIFGIANDPARPERNGTRIRAALHASLVETPPILRRQGEVPQSQRRDAMRLLGRATQWGEGLPSVICAQGPTTREATGMQPATPPRQEAAAAAEPSAPLGLESEADEDFLL